MRSATAQRTGYNSETDRFDEPARGPLHETNHTYRIESIDGADWGLWSGRDATQAVELLIEDAEKHPENYSGQPVLEDLRLTAV